MRGFIYIIKNDINSKVYIGQTTRALKDRWKEHLRTKCSKNENSMLIKKAIHKYGSSHFRIELLEVCNRASLNEREMYYIHLYNSYHQGYNRTLGGQSGSKPIKLKNKQNEIVELYQYGFSIKYLAQEYNVDKATIKHVLLINNVTIRDIRSVKYSTEERQAILEDTKLLPRNIVMKKWNISASYLSQLINNKRRI